MSEIQVTSSTIRSKASDLTSQNSRFKTAVDELKATVKTLRAEYEGDASTAFEAKFNSDAAKWDQFYTAISQYASALEGIAATYETAEASATAIANS